MKEARQLLKIAKSLVAQDVPPYAKAIMDAVNKAIRKMDSGSYEEAEFYEGRNEDEIIASYRANKLPRDAYEINEYELDDLVGDEQTAFVKAFRLPSNLKKYIKYSDITTGDKGWMEIRIDLIKPPLEGRINSLDVDYIKEGYDNVTSLFYMIEFNRNPDKKEANDWFKKNWPSILKRASKEKTPQGFINPLQVSNMNKWEKSGPDWLHQNGNVWVGEIAVTTQSSDRPDNEFEKMRDALKKWGHQDLKFEEGFQTKDEIIMSGNTDSTEVKHFLNYLRKDFGKLFDVKIKTGPPTKGGWGKFYILTFTKAK
jgi:hypothetical protein